MAKFYSIEEVVDSLCLMSGDIYMRNKGLYLSVAKEVFDDMNEDVLKIASRIKIPVRQIFVVDKRTNSITIPKSYLKICSVNAVDRYGCFTPLYRNDGLSDDIVDLGAAQDCGCENNCSSRLCNMMKGFEEVQTIKSDYMPDSTPISFTCTDKKVCDSQGFVYTQTQYPLRVYLSGVWTDTILHTENTKTCKVEVDDNGCICDTEENLNLICDSCGIQPNSVCYGGTSTTPPTATANTWIYQCASKMEWFNTQCGSYPYKYGDGFNNIYNISELGNQIIFPSNFGWDKVMIRFYEDMNLKEIKIPYLAKNCFMTGLQFYSSTNNDHKQQIAQVYEQKFTKQKWGLFLELNKFCLSELKEIFVQNVYVPSYIKNDKYNKRYEW